MSIERVFAAALAASAICLAAATPAAAQVRDAVYRGTLVCTPLPFLKGHLRAAMEVTVNGATAKYVQPVINAEKGTLIGTEEGRGTIEGSAIRLAGSWSGDRQSFEAVYNGTFVRRAARLTGTQIWTFEGKTYKRTCSGAVKRPFAVFLKRDGAR
ncbi:MAG TPA: hypothetical protein VHA55_12935 [Pseudorhodoplanes sp.]|jgi:hypothetical protein|nr:hypothetical protein [Pseudorhodoplanes sp.]